MIQLEFITELIFLLGGAVLIIVVSRPLKLPAIVGFLVTGMLIGPSGLDFIQDRELIEMYAELGVVMLLFFIGLEFSISHLRSIWRQMLIGGSAQVVLTTLLVVGVFSLGPFSFGERIFYGFLVALSSTAIALKMLTERGEMDTPQGRLALGVCLFQDFAIVPMIVVTPLLAGGSGGGSWALFNQFGLGLLAITALVFGARFVLPWILRFVAQARIREAFLMVSLLICLLLAHVTAMLGFSYALGAFLAGLIVSESEYSHEVVAEVISFRDLFTSVFFISIGMLLDLSFVADEFVGVIGLSLGIFVLKVGVLLVIGTWLRLSPRSTVIAALTLAQVGEFSFVLAEVGKSATLLNEAGYQFFLAASIFTMIVSPPLIMFSPVIAERAQHMLPIRRLPSEGDVRVTQPLEDHVLIAGYGVNGGNLARVLKETGIPYVILETDPDSGRRAVQDGHPVVFGDVTRREILEKGEIRKARLLVFAISDPPATRSSVKLARMLNPSLFIIVRTRLVAEVDGLMHLGANEVIPEEFETSIEIFMRVLNQYHIPRNVINAQIKVIRDENYRMLRGLPQTERGLDRVAQLLAGGTSDTFLITDECTAVGRSILELDFRGRTGTTVLAVVRGTDPTISPPPDFRLEVGDILVLVGTHASMDKAFAYLESHAERDGA